MTPSVAVSNTPLSDAGLLAFDDYVAKIRQRLVSGKENYGDKSFTQPLVSLIDEIQAELEDVAGWSFIQWTRLERGRKKLQEGLDGSENLF